MVRLLVMALLICVNYALQSTVFKSMAVLGVAPDTALVFIVSYGILRGDIEGAVFGFFAGIVHDIFGGYYIGLYAMLGMLTGFFCGKPFKNFFKDNYFLPFFVVVTAAVCYQFLFYCASYLFMGELDFLYFAGTIILPKSIYTASFAVPLYILLHLINARVERYEYNRRSLFKDMGA